jgi:hypothetical protein
MTVSIVERSTLKMGKKIGDGGEGEVYLVTNKPSDVFKVFKDAVRSELNESGLASTIGLLELMSPADRAFIASRAAWPHTLVKDKGSFGGFLMPLLPSDYFCLHGGKGSPIEGMNDWNKLTFRKAWMNNPNLESNSPALWYPSGRDTDSLNASEKKKRISLLKLLKDLSQVFEILHKHNIVVGDVSGRNILWSRQNGDSVMLIDCDGCRINKTVGVTKAKQSPEWFDPHLNGPTNIESDLYKLAIAIYRGYFSDSLGKPEHNSVSLVSNADREIQRLSLRGVGQSARPTASEWVNALSNLITESENDGRPVIVIDKSGPHSSANPSPSGRPQTPTDIPRPLDDWRNKA